MSNPLVVQYVNQQSPQTIEDVKQLVTQFFDNEIWSNDKDEFDRMSDIEKNEFYNKLVPNSLIQYEKVFYNKDKFILKIIPTKFI